MNTPEAVKEALEWFDSRQKGSIPTLSYERGEVLALAYRASQAALAEAKAVALAESRQAIAESKGADEARAEVNRLKTSTVHPDTYAKSIANRDALQSRLDLQAEVVEALKAVMDQAGRCCNDPTDINWHAPGCATVRATAALAKLGGA